MVAQIICQNVIETWIVSDERNKTDAGVMRNVRNNLLRVVKIKLTREPTWNLIFFHVYQELLSDSRGEKYQIFGISPAFIVIDKITNAVTDKVIDYREEDEKFWMTILMMMSDLTGCLQRILLRHQMGWPRSDKKLFGGTKRNFWLASVFLFILLVRSFSNVRFEH